MKIAYADPPYLGQSAKHYRKHPDYAGEVDHEVLIRFLNETFSDGWALSCSSPSLRTLLPLCPEDVRVMAWVKPFAVFKPNVNPAYAWEPVIVRGGRQPRNRAEPTVRDWVSANITLRKGLVGVKPPGFCYWLFDVMGLRAGDELVDLFPGSGAVGKAWKSLSDSWTQMGEDWQPANGLIDPVGIVLDDGTFLKADRHGTVQLDWTVHESDPTEAEGMEDWIGP